MINCPNCKQAVVAMVKATMPIAIGPRGQLILLQRHAEKTKFLHFWCAACEERVVNKLAGTEEGGR